MSDPAPSESGGDAKLMLARRLRETAGTSEAPERALRYAALSSKFLPEAALTAAGLKPGVAARPGDPDAMVRFATAARLADACDTRIWQPHWIMRTNARARVIEAMGDEAAGIVAWRRGQPDFDAAAQVICDALLGEGDFAPQSVEAALHETHSTEELEQLIRGISLALPLAPARDLVDPLRAALAEMGDDVDAALTRKGVFGRDAEIEEIDRLIRAQWAGTAAPGRLGLVYVGGMGGIGKSTLLSLARQAFRKDGAICVALDFDRPGIEGRDSLGLSLELARQVAEAAGPDGGPLYAAITRSLGQLDERRDNARTVAQDLIGEVTTLLDRTKRRLLLSLDTLESLTLRGDDAAHGLVEWLHAIRSRTPLVAILAAGRDTLSAERPTLPPLLAGEAEAVPLTGLPDEAALALLRELGVDDAPAQAIIALAKGNPLVLHLAARLSENGGQALFAPGALDPSLPSEALAGQLYRLILSRVEPQEVRAVAHPGLLLRQINAAMLVDLVAPEIGLSGLTPETAQAMLDQLARHAWLVDVRDGWLSHRPELRAILLDLQIADNPARARRLFAAAADWHGKRGDAVLALYYRLQLLRWSRRKIDIDADLAAQFTGPMIEELPTSARDRIAIARGERSAMFRAPVTVAASKRAVAPPDFGPGAASELRMLLERRARSEAALMIGRVRDLSAIDPRSPEMAAVIEALWRGGDNRRALPLLRKRRRLAGVDAFPLDEAGLFLIAAFADLDPAAFRTQVRSVPEWAQDLASRIGSIDDPDWEVAGLLLRAEGFTTEQRFVQAVWRLWADAVPDQAVMDAMDAALRRDAGLPSATTPADLAGLIDRLAPDTAHREILLCRLLVKPPAGGLAPVAQLALASAQAMSGPIAPEEAMDYLESFAVERIDRRGGLGPFATALALMMPGLGLGPVAEAIRRRLATLAGHWSYGDPPAGWRQPPTDWRAMIALARLGTTPVQQATTARAEIDRWRAGQGTQPARRFTPLVARAEAIVARIPMPLLGDREAGLQRAAQMLAEAGMPLALVPPFAVLAPDPQAMSRPPSDQPPSNADA